MMRQRFRLRLRPVYRWCRFDIRAQSHLLCHGTQCTHSHTHSLTQRTIFYFGKALSVMQNIWRGRDVPMIIVWTMETRQQWPTYFRAGNPQQSSYTIVVVAIKQMTR